jgi:hypothetical protein
MLPVSYVFEALQALTAAEADINQLNASGGSKLEDLWNEAAGGAATLNAVELQVYIARTFPVLNIPQPMHIALKWAMLDERDKQVLKPHSFMLVLKTLCKCCRAYIAVGPLTSERPRDGKGISQHSIDFESFCFEYLSSAAEKSISTKDGSAVGAGYPRSTTRQSEGATLPYNDQNGQPMQLSKLFRDFELEFGLEELLMMACNSSACAVVTSALARQVKLCVEQGAAASVCHAAWCRLQNFKAVVQLLRQSVVEGEAIAQEKALRPLVQKVLIF